MFISDENSSEIMNPSLNDKIEGIINIIDIIISNSKLDNRKLIILLLQMLSIDLSPCLAIAILKIFLFIFSTQKIPHDRKKKLFEFVFDNNFFEILINLYNFSLLDCRCFIISLLSEVSIYNKILPSSKKLENIVIPLLGENLLPKNFMKKISLDQVKSYSPSIPLKAANQSKLSIELKDSVIAEEDTSQIDLLSIRIKKSLSLVSEENKEEKKESSYKQRWTSGRSVERTTINIDVINTINSVGGEHGDKLFINSVIQMIMKKK